MTIEIDNPCYHCYTGAVGYCNTYSYCRFLKYPWSEDLEGDYKVEIDEKDLNETEID